MVDMTRPLDPYELLISSFHSDMEATSASAKGFLVLRESTQQPASVFLSPLPNPVTAKQLADGPRLDTRKAVAA